MENMALCELESEAEHMCELMDIISKLKNENANLLEENMELHRYHEMMQNEEAPADKDHRDEEENENLIAQKNQKIGKGQPI